MRTWWLARTEAELLALPSLSAPPAAPATTAPLPPSAPGAPPVPPVPAAMPAAIRWLTDAERSRAGQLRYAKRRTDFLLGRWTLKIAAARVLGWPDDPDGLARIEGRTAADGAPELYLDGRPAARGISLSDRAGCAVCLIAAGPADVGCDIEIVEPRSAAFTRDYLTEPEHRFVGAAGPARDLAANLLWSAKESALKVLRTGLRRDTRSVEVTVADLHPPERTWSPLAVRAAEGTVFPGWWRRSGPFLLTVCGRTGGPSPVALEAPSPLDEAVPSHRWLDDPLA
jgi:4'-phosphopantetheinyl transferase